VFQHGIRERGKIDVLRKEIHRRHDGSNLNQPAILAYKEFQWKLRLLFNLTGMSQKIVG
jgi:hypothetical protein